MAEETRLLPNQRNKFIKKLETLLNKTPFDESAQQQVIKHLNTNKDTLRGMFYKRRGLIQSIVHEFNFFNSSSTQQARTTVIGLIYNRTAALVDKYNSSGPTAALVKSILEFPSLCFQTNFFDLLRDKNESDTMSFVTPFTALQDPVRQEVEPESCKGYVMIP